MGSHFCAFFKNANGQFPLLFLSQLREMDTHAQSRWPRTDDDHIKIHYFSFHD